MSILKQKLLNIGDEFLTLGFVQGLNLIKGKNYGIISYREKEGEFKWKEKE